MFGLIQFQLCLIFLVVGYGRSQQLDGSPPPRPTTGVRFYYGTINFIAANFSMISSGDINSIDRNADGQNDGVWCQSALDETMIGTWYSPNGVVVPSGSGSPVYSYNTGITGQVGLLRNGGLSGHEGLYRCVIPNEEGVTQTLYLAVYTFGEYDSNELPSVTNLTYQLISSPLYAGPQMFSLSFNVTNRPPTTVTCTVNGTQLNISNDDVIRTVIRTEDPIEVQVTVIIRSGEGGQYQCAVTNARIESDSNLSPVVTSIRNITVTSPPTGLNVTRINVTSVLLQWTAPFSTIRYYIIYFNGVGQTASNTTTELIQTVQPDLNYTITIVAIDPENLPNNGLTAFLPQVANAQIEGPDIVPYFSNFTLTCTAKISGNYTTGIGWIDANNNTISSTFGSVALDSNGTQVMSSMGSTVYTLRLHFHQVEASKVGEYQCVVFVSSVVLTRRFTVSIQFPSPIISITSSPSTGPIYESTNFNLTCTATLPNVVNTPVTANVVWTDPNGNTIPTNDPRRQVIGPVGLESTLFFLPIDNGDGNSSNNDTGTYNCQMTVSSTNTLILNATNSNNISIVVEQLPPIQVNMSSVGSVTVGQRLNITCSVILPQRLIVAPTVLIVRSNDSSTDMISDLMIPFISTIDDTGSLIMITLFLEPVKANDGGVYSCLVDFNVTGFNNTNDPNTATYDYRYGEDSLDVNLLLDLLTTPMSISTDPAPLVEGQFLNIVCTANISQFVNSPIAVTLSWRRNGTALTNGSDYIISPVTSVSNMYISTLGINSLEYNRDNYAFYTCSINASFPSSFITSNNTKSTGIILRVEDFDANHVHIAINIPSVPVAGNGVTLVCNITVPERLTHDLSSVRWTYTLGAIDTIDELNSNAVVGNITRNGNTFTRNLTINSVMTSDAREYYCLVAFNTLGVIDRTNRNLNVQIAPPSVSITSSPSTGPIYESTTFNLTCTATLPNVVNTPVIASVVWTDPNGNTIPTNDPRRQVIGPVGLESTLMFLPIDNGDHNSFNNDTGTYNCQMTISSANTLILIGANSTNTTIARVEKLPAMHVTLSSVGSPEAGQKLNITCTVTVTERLVVTPTIVFMRSNDTSMDLISDLMIPYITTSDDSGSVTNITLILDPVRANDGGIYSCMAEFNVTGIDGTNDPNTATYDYREADDTLNITIDIPPVAVRISQEREGILYAGTSFYIACIITLSPHVTFPVTVTNQWTRNNDPMAPFDETITARVIAINSLTYNATLTFYPLDNTDDSGEYTCNVLVRPTSINTYIRNTSASNGTDITVHGIPQPHVSIVTTGDTDPGQDYMLNCTVYSIERLIVRPGFIWRKSAVDTLLVSPELNIISVPSVQAHVSSTVTSSYLNFTSLDTSDAGQYTCEAIIRIDQINSTTVSSDSVELPLQIPTPFLNVYLSRQADFLAGSSIVINCDILIDSNVNTPFTVDVKWMMMQQIGSGSGESGEDIFEGPIITVEQNDRVNISDLILLPDLNQYRSQLTFNTLSSMVDSGTYMCNVTIRPSEGYDYVDASYSIWDSTTFTVIDPLIDNFAVFPVSFLGLETSCPDSDPYDNYTLTCTASKPAIVLPDLAVVWYHNGSILETGIITGNDTHVTNTLLFPNSTFIDSGTYSCHASIDIPDSTTIERIRHSAVTLRGQHVPYTPIAVSSTVGETTANITFTIPAISYTPESYHINYTGMVLQNTLTSSMSLFSSNNINDVNVIYQITLTGLEEGNTYNYTVVSTNCIGSTSSTVTTFTTLSTEPSGIPRNCVVSNIGSNSAVLQWVPPIIYLQNSLTISYRVTCYQGNNVVSMGNTSSTTLSLSGLSPFTNYVCSLSAFNLIGTGPNTQCIFTSGQDRPGTPPRDFTSVPAQTSITFTWRRPTTPNGIITVYNLTVINVATSIVSTYLINVAPNHGTVTGEVAGFSPQQDYTATVSASTISGYGPVASDSGITLQEGTCALDTTNSSKRGTFNWPNIAVGNTATLPCPNGPSGTNATRMCLIGNAWGSPNISFCGTAVTALFANLANSITQSNITAENVGAISESLNTLISGTSDSADQNPNNLQVVSSVLSQTAALFSDPAIAASLPPEVVAMASENTIGMLDEVEEWPADVVESQSNAIVQSFERITDALVNQENFTNVTLLTSDIAFKGEKIEKSSFNGITFATSSSNKSLNIGTQEGNASNSDGVTSTISLPQSIVNLVSSDSVSFSFTLYNQATLFPVRVEETDTTTKNEEAGKTGVGSSVISASVGGITEDMTFEEPVTVVLALANPQTGTSENITNPRCVYWDFKAADGKGNWSSEGCTTIVTNASDLSSVMCSCTHLTNFACLVDISSRTGAEPPPEEFTITLEILTYIGVSVSVIGLIITIITHLVFKKIRQRDASKFHIQLSLALLGMLVVFVGGIDQVSINELCITVGVLIHYFGLAACTWMGAEALLMFQKLVYVFWKITWRYLLVVSIVCWVAPLVPVVITVAIDRDFYVMSSNNSDGFCFLGDLYPFLGAFLIPIFLIMIFNLIMFVLVIRVLLLHTTKKNKRLSKGSLTPGEAIKMLISYAGIMFLFGLTWLTGVLTFISEPAVSFIVQFIFTVFNAFQGFFIFVFFVVLSGDARNAWRSVFCPCIKTKEQTSSRYQSSIISRERSTVRRSSTIGRETQSIRKPDKKESHELSDVRLVAYKKDKIKEEEESFPTILEREEVDAVPTLNEIEQQIPLKMEDEKLCSESPSARKNLESSSDKSPEKCEGEKPTPVSEPHSSEESDDNEGSGSEHSAGDNEGSGSEHSAGNNEGSGSKHSAGKSDAEHSETESDN